MHDLRLPAVCLALAIAGGAVHAQEPPLSRLERNLQTCTNCHGAPAFEAPTVDNYLVPRLGGQQAAYLIKTLKAYKMRQRDHFFMRGIAASLSEEEMQELATYFSEQPARVGASQ